MVPSWFNVNFSNISMLVSLIDEKSNVVLALNPSEPTISVTVNELSVVKSSGFIAVGKLSGLSSIRKVTSTSSPGVNTPLVISRLISNSNGFPSTALVLLIVMLPLRSIIEPSAIGSSAGMTSGLSVPVIVSITDSGASSTSESSSTGNSTITSVSPGANVTTNPSPLGIKPFVS